MGTLPSSRRGKCVTLFGGQQHRNVKTGNKGWGTKTHRKNFAESLSRQQWGKGKTPPKAARIRHPKIPPLNYAARGEESLRQGVTNKQKFQSTVSCPIPDVVRGGYDEKGCGQALPTFSKRMDETFLTPLADQQKKKKKLLPNNKQNYVLKSRTKKIESTSTLSEIIYPH
ncbi:hypothetical protein TNCV_2288151 [Trichonephila clavipes]|nr:hypothetical protein TNCV_2288151 [Trichonephila clavipes]